MSGRFNVYLLYVVALILALGQCIYFYPLMPERMASHFGPSGEPNGWMDKNSFFQFYAIMLIGTTGLMAGIGALMSKIPVELMNLPNKDYWMAPERREQTLSTLQNQMHYLGVATAALLIAMMQLTFQANRTPGTSMDGIAFVFVGIYMVFTLAWTIGLIVRFSTKK